MSLRSPTIEDGIILFEIRSVQNILNLHYVFQSYKCSTDSDTVDNHIALSNVQIAMHSIDVVLRTAKGRIDRAAFSMVGIAFATLQCQVHDQFLLLSLY